MSVEEMKRALLAALICSLTAGFAAAQDEPCHPRRHPRIPAIRDLTYHAARKRLLAAGWKPLRTKSANDPDVSEGNGPSFWRRGYSEVEACSGTGLGNCAFLFKDGYGNHLRVITAGEELPKDKAYARVTGFRFVCE